MVILFILSGFVFGSSAAALAIWAGGSILLAVLAYSIVGVLGAMLAILAVYLVGEMTTPQAEWAEIAEDGHKPVSA